MKMRNIKLLRLIFIWVLLGLFIYFIFEFIKYPEYFLTTWKYQLKNEILNSDKNAIILYEDIYVKNNKDLFGDNFAIRDTYLFKNNNINNIDIESESKSLIDIENYNNINSVQNITDNNSNNFKQVYDITAYCACKRCCGKSNGITASGVKAIEGITIAADTKVLPFGTKVIIDGNTYIVQDRGGAIKGNRIDIYFDTHEKALQYGRQTKEVIILE